MVSRHHLIAWSAQKDAQVAAIADPHRDRAEARASEFGIPQVFADVAQMLDETRPDALDVATPVHTHSALVRLAAGRGIAVLCQKPLAPSLEEAAGLVSLGDRAPIMVHENWRFRRPYRLARRWIGQGRIGRVRRFAITAESSGLVPEEDGALPPALVRQPFLADLPRLVVFELLIHHLDVARALCGEVTVVAACAGRTSTAVRGEDHAAILLAGDGVFGTVTGDFTVPGRPAFIADAATFVGETGAILIEGARCALMAEGRVAEEHRFDPEAIAQSGYDGAIGHFVRSLRRREGFETSLADNLRTIRLLEQVYAALG